MMVRNALRMSALLFGLFILLVPAATSRATATEDSLCALTDIADSLSFSWQWERTLTRLTLLRPDLQMRFYEGNAFCLVNGRVWRLASAPLRRGATLYMPRSVVRSFFEGDTVTVAPKLALTDTVVKSDAGPLRPAMNIVSFSAEKKSNGTLITIQLTDSLPLDITYFYPNLTFNFFGGKVDTAIIRQRERIGVVDSVFATQFKVSSQITALLAREIEEPMIDYVQDTKTIMISLWPKKRTAVVKKAETTPVALPADSPSTTIIVLDPGHGGKDPGAISPTGIKEKEIVLAIGLKVRDMLKQRQGVKIHMTRDKDVFVPLSDRTKFANDKKAHLFISIHANAVGGNEKRKQSTNGYKIYFLSQAKNEEDKLVAMHENAVIELEDKPQRYSELQNVLIEMAGTEYLRESQELCILLEQKFNLSLGKKINRLNKGVGQANFWVLNGAFMPSVLIEAGFISHKKEEKLLVDAAFQNSMATAISDAIIGFCKRLDGVGL